MLLNNRNHNLYLGIYKKHFNKISFFLMDGNQQASFEPVITPESFIQSQKEAEQHKKE